MGAGFFSCPNALPGGYRCCAVKKQISMNSFAGTFACLLILGCAETLHKYAKPGHYLVSVEHVSDQGLRAVARLQVRVGIE